MHAGAGPNRSFHSYSKDINFVSKILDGHEIKNTCELAIFLAIFSGEVMDTIVSITETLASLYYGFDALSSKWLAELAQTAGVEDLVEWCVGSRGGRVEA